MLSVASRRIRTSMWSALQSTNLFATNVALASGEEPPEDEFALKANNDEDEDNGGEGSDDGCCDFDYDCHSAGIDHFHLG